MCMHATYTVSALPPIISPSNSLSTSSRLALATVVTSPKTLVKMCDKLRLPTAISQADFISWCTLYVLS